MKHQLLFTTDTEIYLVLLDVDKYENLDGLVETAKYEQFHTLEDIKAFMDKYIECIQTAEYRPHWMFDARCIRSDEGMSILEFVREE